MTTSFTSLWGRHLTEEKPRLNLNTKELNSSLVINRASLVSGSEAVINLEIDGQSFVLGTLQKDKKEFMRLEIRLFEIFQESYTIFISGKDSKVDLTGYYHPPEDISDDSGLESSMGSSDNELGSNVMIEEVSDEEAKKAIEPTEKKALEKKKRKRKKEI